MNDTTQAILFEYPLNEKIRTWLRIEFLLGQIHQRKTRFDVSNSLMFFRVINELLDVLERGDIRADLLKEIDRQQKKLNHWSNLPEVDPMRLDHLKLHLNQVSAELSSISRLGQDLKEDKIISSVKQRLSIPGGCCSFDLPSLHIWIHSPKKNKNEQINLWLNKLSPLTRSLTAVLNIIRQSGEFKERTGINGFYQDQAENGELLRMHIPSELYIYPQVSGHKTRYAIRFLPLDNDNGIIPERIKFELACC